FASTLQSIALLSSNRSCAKSARLTSRSLAMRRPGGSPAMGSERRTNGSSPESRLGPWFHNLHLPDGRQTAPGHPFGDFPAVKWRQVEPCIPRNLRGWRALDVGCNAGFYSFELARRGAEVTAIDVDRRYLQQARWAA